MKPESDGWEPEPAWASLPEVAAEGVAVPEAVEAAAEVPQCGPEPAALPRAPEPMASAPSG